MEFVEFVEMLTALLLSFLWGLLIEWLLLHGLFKLIAKQAPEEMPSAQGATE
jgi:hypothetical protein